MTDEDDPCSDRTDSTVFPGDRPQNGPDVEPPSHAVVRAVADSLDTGLTDLPPLNDVVDTDALDTLVGHRSLGRRPTVRFSYADHIVTITEPEGLTLSPRDEVNSATGELSPDWPHVTPISANGDERSYSDLVARVVLAVARRSDYDPAHVRRAIDETLNCPALSRLNNERVDGAVRSGATVQFSALGYDVFVDSDETVAIGSEIQRLHLTGANVLLVGAVPDSITDLASVQLLGSGARDRRRLFALLDRHVDSALDRLSMIDGASETARAIDYASTVRSAVDSRPSSEPGTDAAVDTDAGSGTNIDAPTDLDSTRSVGPEHDGARDIEDLPAVTTETVDDTLDTFAATTELAIESIQTEPLEPTELRFCFDSLRPLLEERGVDGTRTLLEPICERVSSASGIGHYVFPTEYDSEQVRALEPLFDATIEIRIDGEEPTQRWHLHGSSYTTEWFSLRTD